MSSRDQLSTKTSGHKNNPSDTTGQVLPEGFVSYVTSAGNTVNVSDPAEYTNHLATNPSQKR